VVTTRSDHPLSLGQLTSVDHHGCDDEAESVSTFDATSLPDDGARRVVFHCRSGKRSLTAAEHRLAAGQGHAAHMGGGIAAWKAAGLPVITPGTPR
jgi:rhodanese-related sulfurtransferase